MFCSLYWNIVNMWPFSNIQVFFLLYVEISPICNCMIFFHEMSLIQCFLFFALKNGQSVVLTVLCREDSPSCSVLIFCLLMYHQYVMHFDCVSLYILYIPNLLCFVLYPDDSWICSVFFLFLTQDFSQVEGGTYWTDTSHLFKCQAHNRHSIQHLPWQSLFQSYNIRG